MLKFKQLSLGVLAMVMASTAPALAQPASKAPATKVAPVPMDIKLVDQYTPKAGELGIAYKKFVLPNGLTVLLHEDHSNPLVHVDVTYHVGSAREEVGKSGFAHFFEHMMFQGSDNVADEEHFKIISGAGGDMNGTTNRDRTNYYETVPKNYLETALWLESDRMGFLLDAVTQQKFEVQRATVKNERGQRYDNVPYGVANEVLNRNLYPFGHPYSWSTIGYVADLDRVGVQDLKNFFLRWYGPNNATVTIGGDFKEAEALALVWKYFGSIPEGPEVKDAPVQLPKLDKDRFISYEDNFARLPRLYVAFPGLEGHNAEEPALDLVAEKLGGGANSLLYKNLVKTGLARNAVAYNPTSELSGEFMIMVDPFPGKAPADILAVVRQTIEELAKEGINDDDLARFKASREVQAINSLSTVSGKVSRLASYQTLAKGNPKKFLDEFAAVNSLTKEKAMAAYKKYIAGKPAVILTVVPKGKPELKAAPDNYTVVESVVSPSKEYDGLTYNKAKDSFNRSKKPIPGKTPAVTLPTAAKQALSNGIAVNHILSDELPMTYVYASFPGGRALENNMLAKVGIMNLTASMLEESTKNYTTEAFSNALDKLGASIDVSVSDENVNVYVATPSKNISATMKLVEERLFSPAFKQEDFDRLKSRLVEAVKVQADQPTAISRSVTAKLAYGAKNVLAYPAVGTEASLSSLTVEDVKKCYEQMFPGKDAFLVVASDKALPTLLPNLQVFSKFKPVPTMAPKLQGPLAITKTKIYLVNKDNTPQSEVRIIGNGVKYDATGDYFKAGIMNYMLGGSFNSRINLTLREKRGFTYGARSGFSAASTYGVFTAGAAVRGNATDSSVADFMNEINTFKTGGITTDELEYTKKAQGQAEALDYESAQDKLGFIAGLLRYNLPTSITQEQAKVRETLTKAEVDTLAQKLLTTDKMHIVVVGDKARTLPGLQKLGYEVVELDKNGEVVK